MLFLNALKRTEKISFFQRCVGWCEAQDALFLLTLEQSFRIHLFCWAIGKSTAIYGREERQAAVIGFEWRASRNLSGTAGLCLRLNSETGAFCFYSGISTVSNFDLSGMLYVHFLPAAARNEPKKRRLRGKGAEKTRQNG